MFSRPSSIYVAGFFLALMGDAFAAAPRASQTVAVMELRARGLDEKVVMPLLDIVSEQVAVVPQFKVLSRTEVEAMLSEEARRQMMGCDTSSCLAELAGALNAELVVAGEVAKLGGGTLFTLQLINQRYATVMNRVSLNWPGPVDGLPDVARAAAELLVLERSERKAGKVIIQSAPLGALYYFDEKRVHLSKIDNVEVGVHLVRISSNGHADRTVPVIVRSGKTVHVNGSLIAIPLYKRPAFWIGAATAIGAVAAVAAVVLAGIPLVTLLLWTGDARVQANGSVPNAEAP